MPQKKKEPSETEEQKTEVKEETIVEASVEQAKEEKKEKKTRKKKSEEETETKEIPEIKEVKEISKSGKLEMLPLEDYVKSGIHLGTKVITPHMRPYVYRRRADGLAVINTNLIDKKLKEASQFLNKFKPEDIMIVCKREAGWIPIKMFSEVTGIKCFTKKYPAGAITNTSLPNFFEVELTFICDPWLDKNALKDSNITKKKVLAVCDTNNLTFGIDQIIPGNNKSNKSLGTIMYVLAREYLKARKIDKKLPEIEDFVGEELEVLPEKRKDIRAEEELAKGKRAIEERLRALTKDEAKEGV